MWRALGAVATSIVLVACGGTARVAADAPGTLDVSDAGVTDAGLAPSTVAKLFVMLPRPISAFERVSVA